MFSFSDNKGGMVMSCSMEIIKIEDGWATISIRNKSERLRLPLYLLPEDSRQGDILKLHIHFSPYETLDSLLKG